MTDESLDRDSGREPRLALLLRVVVYAIGAVILTLPLAAPSGVVLAGLGGAVGCLAGLLLADSRLRLPTVVLGAMAVVGVAVGLRGWLVGAAWMAQLLGPTGALATGDALLFGLGGFGVSVALRALSLRYRALAVLEVALVAFGFAAIFVAHRHGAIHRPYAISDPMLAAGQDPTLAFLVIGALGAAVVAALLLSERNVFRNLLHLAVVGAVIVLVFAVTASFGLPTGPDTDALGLRDGDEEREGEGGGQSDEPIPDNFEEGQRQTPMAVVLFRDDYAPPSGVHYFRQEAHSRYNGSRLVAALSRDLDRDVSSLFPGRDPVDVPAAPTLEDRRLLDTDIALLDDHARPFGLVSPTRFSARTNPNPARFRRIYRATSAVLNDDVDFFAYLWREVGDVAWDEETRAHYLEGPDDPRYAELAARVIEGLPAELRDAPVARALAVTQYLGEHGTYSLRARHAHAADPTADFLFGDLTGYCVHFAHAATYLFRSLGIPARVSQGYAINDAARQGGSALLLRSSDAHAWPEVYVDGLGWVVLDVSPERVLTPPPGPPDPDLQRLLAELARGMSDSGEPTRVTDWQEQLASWGSGAWVAAQVALAVLLGAFLLGRGWRPLAPYVLSGRSRSQAIYRAALQALSEHGIRRRWGESREAFADRVASDLPAWGRLTDAHLALAFGHPDRVPEPSTFADLRRALGRELSARTPWWRRLVAQVDPFAWLLAR